MENVDLSKLLPYGIGEIRSAGELFSKLNVPAFSIAATAVVFYMAIGAFRWIASGGNKESIAAAREMITHAVIAFVMLIFLFLVVEYLPNALGVLIKVTNK